MHLEAFQGVAPDREFGSANAFLATVGGSAKGELDLMQDKWTKNSPKGLKNLSRWSARN